jgi:lysophospholipase L1-like esterase
MVDDCISADIAPVVLSPFVYGSRYTMRNAIVYTNALHQLYSRVHDMIFIDCIRALATFPRSMLLMNDGFHLSGLAHKLIGEAIAQAILAEVRTKNGNSGISEVRSAAAQVISAI